MWWVENLKLLNAFDTAGVFCFLCLDLHEQLDVIEDRP